MECKCTDERMCDTCYEASWDDDNDYPVYIGAPHSTPDDCRPSWYHVPHLDSAQ